MALPRDIVESNEAAARKPDVARRPLLSCGAQSATGAEAKLAAPSKELFVEYLQEGAKPREEWRCGVEVEFFGFEASTLERINPAQVEAILGSVAPLEAVKYENGTAVESTLRNGARLTVEPGGQVEFSSFPRTDLIEIEHDLSTFLAQLREIGAALNIVFVGAGFDPLTGIYEQRWFPKQRYEVMKPYMAKQGRRAWDMMCRTCAIQVNLDYESEADLAKKYLVGNRLAPIVTAMFANSPFEGFAPSGYKSTRAAAWLETDDDRSGVSPLAFEEGFSFERFVEYAFNVPMLFVRRGDLYLDDVTGIAFGKFLNGAVRNLRPVLDDWTDHLSTIFTEARLKQYVELRCMDSGSVENALAAQALWKGLLYDGDTLDEALRHAPRLSQGEWRELQASVARDALGARACGVNVLGLAKDVIGLARQGLRRIAPEELRYLDWLEQLVCVDEICPADILLRNWTGSWHGSVREVIRYLRVA
jgi:glutamate--cysteine ligase